MTEDDAFVYATSLIWQSIEKIEMNYLRALERGVVDPVVLLLALRDPIARTIAEQSGQVERIARVVEKTAHSDGVPTVIIGLPLLEACRITAGLLPGLREAVSSMDVGPGYIVVAVAHGGAIIKTMQPVPGSDRIRRSAPTSSGVRARHESRWAGFPDEDET